MKRNNLVLILLLFICFYVNSQDSCSVLYSLNCISLDTNKTFSENTFHVSNKNRHVSFKNNCFYLNGIKILRFKKVNYYAEIRVVLISEVLYLYIYPIYHGEGGPYVWTLGNGVLIQINDNKKLKKWKNLGYLDTYGCCEDIINYLKIKE